MSCFGRDRNSGILKLQNEKTQFKDPQPQTLNPKPQTLNPMTKLFGLRLIVTSQILELSFKPITSLGFRVQGLVV